MAQAAKKPSSAMSNRRNAIYLLLIFSLLVGLASGRALMFNMAYILGGLLLVSLFWAWGSVSWTRVVRQTRARRAQVGKTFEEAFAVRNTSIIPKLWLEIRDHSTLPGHRASHVAPSMLPGSSHRWNARTVCAARGEFQLGPVTLISGDPFGLFQFPRHLGATSKIIVYPATVPIHDFAISIGLLPGGDAQRRRAHFVTTNAAGVREYAPGDGFNRIHWRSTARRHRLIVKEFELDPMADVWVFLDISRESLIELPGLRANGDGPLNNFFAPPPNLPASTEEYGVVIAASIAKFFLDKGRNLGFITYGPNREIIQVDRSQRQLNQILELLAIVRSGHTNLAEMLRLDTQIMSRGTTLIIITADQTEGWVKESHTLKRRGMRLITTLIDPSSFGGESNTTLTQQRLATMNIPTYVVQQGDDLTAVLSQHLR